MKKNFLLFALMCLVATLHAQDIKLTAPEKTGGKSF
jgi:hypothetical protein